MSFRNSLLYSMIEYNSIFPTLGAWMDHCFMVIGNGREWSNGNLQDSDGNDGFVAALEVAVSQASTSRPVPDCLRYTLGETDYPTDIQQRMADPIIPHCYGFSNYSRIGHIPDDITPEWLNAALTCIISVLNTPKEMFSDHADYEGTQAACERILGEIRTRFPDHKFESIHRIKLDPTRPLPKDAHLYWPLNGDPVDLTVLVEHFYQALLFAYDFTPKEANKSGMAMLRTILNELADDAVWIGQLVTNDEMHDSSSLELEFLMADVDDEERLKHPIYATMEKFPKSDEAKAYGLFDDTLTPKMKAVRKNFKMKRKNEDKDIPYRGYPNGRSSRAGSLEPAERFTAEHMRYDLEDQGRDALEVIMGAMITCASEQGRRIYRQAILDCLDKHPLPVSKDLEKIERRKKLLSWESTPEKETLMNETREKILHELDTFIL